MFERLFGSKDQDPADRRAHPARPVQDRQVPGPPLRLGARTRTSRPGTSRSGARSTPVHPDLGRSSRTLPRKTVQTDIHCVTRWTQARHDLGRRRRSRRSSSWPASARARPTSSRTPSRATPPTCPLSVLDDDDVLLADTFGGEPLELEHGYPLRLLDPEALLLEEQQVDPRPRVPRPRPARLLGALRLQQRRRPLEGRALQRVGTGPSAPAGAAAATAGSGLRTAAAAGRGAGSRDRAGGSAPRAG